MKIKVLNKKRLVIRIVLFFLLIVIAFLLFYFGKEHKILVDNNTVDINGKTYEAIKYARVTVNGDQKGSLELYSEERDVVTVSGPKHTIKVEIVDEDTDKVIKTEERILNFGKISSFMISVPAVAEKATDVYLPLPGIKLYTPAPEEKVADTETGQPVEAVEIEAPALSD